MLPTFVPSVKDAFACLATSYLSMGSSNCYLTAFGYPQSGLLKGTP